MQGLMQLLRVQARTAQTSQCTTCKSALYAGDKSCRHCGAVYSKAVDEADKDDAEFVLGTAAQTKVASQRRGHVKRSGHEAFAAVMNLVSVD
jgi:hypothetical protein